MNNVSISNNNYTGRPKPLKPIGPDKKISVSKEKLNKCDHFDRALDYAKKTFIKYESGDRAARWIKECLDIRRVRGRVEDPCKYSVHTLSEKRGPGHYFNVTLNFPRGFQKLLTVGYILEKGRDAFKLDGKFDQEAFYKIIEGIGNEDLKRDINRNRSYLSNIELKGSVIHFGTLEDGYINTLKLADIPSAPWEAKSRIIKDSSLYDENSKSSSVRSFGSYQANSFYEEEESLGLISNHLMCKYRESSRNSYVDSSSIILNKTNNENIDEEIVKNHLLSNLNMEPSTSYADKGSPILDDLALPKTAKLINNQPIHRINKGNFGGLDSCLINFIEDMDKYMYLSRLDKSLFDIKIFVKHTKGGPSEYDTLYIYSVLERKEPNLSEHRRYTKIRTIKEETIYINSSGTDLENSINKLIHRNAFQILHNEKLPLKETEYLVSPDAPYKACVQQIQDSVESMGLTLYSDPDADRGLGIEFSNRMITKNSVLNFLSACSSFYRLPKSEIKKNNSGYVFLFYIQEFLSKQQNKILDEDKSEIIKLWNTFIDENKAKIKLGINAYNINNLKLD